MIADEAHLFLLQPFHEALSSLREELEASREEIRKARSEFRGEGL
jgi:hypothetical protein